MLLHVHRRHSRDCLIYNAASLQNVEEFFCSPNIGWPSGVEKGTFHFTSAVSPLRRPEAYEFLPVISLTCSVPGSFCLMLNSRVFNLGEFLPPDIPLDLCHMQFKVPPSLVFSLQAGSFGQNWGEISPNTQKCAFSQASCFRWYELS